jgi:hypothetical protein|tara:strand:- start:11760 stop:12236 length:477 start_codon:yes stop_codon:yes gene_type:complete
MYKLFFKIILLLSVVFSHQFFLTTTEVRLSDNQKSLEITIQTFTHDVEALLKKANFNLANLGSEREDDKIDDFIIDYLSDNFIIQDHYWRYLGKKIDGDFTLFFLEIDKFDSQSTVAVFNTIFMDMYSKQKNIMNVYGTKNVQSSTMTIEEPAFKFEL